MNHVYVEREVHTSRSGHDWAGLVVDGIITVDVLNSLFFGFISGLSTDRMKMNSIELSRPNTHPSYCI